MSPDPLVSICIPVFNRRGLIEACLDSTVVEAGVRQEIAIFDDGSDDGSGDVIASWIRRHPEAVVHFDRGPHRGIAPACNRLVEMAGGDVLAWLGSDDLLLDGGLLARLRYLQTHPQKLAVFGDARVIDRQGRPLYDSAYAGYRNADKRRFFSDAGLRAELISRWCIPQPVLMVRREIYGVLGNYDESFDVEDYDFYLRMLARNAIGFLDAPVAAYRVHSGNMSWHPATRTPMMRQFLRAARKNRAGFRWQEQVRLLAFGTGALIKSYVLDSMQKLKWGSPPPRA